MFAKRVTYAELVCYSCVQTDDDSFVNVPGLTAVLRQECRNTGCRREALYMGYQVSSCRCNDIQST